MGKSLASVEGLEEASYRPLEPRAVSPLALGQHEVRLDLSDAISLMGKAVITYCYQANYHNRNIKQLGQDLAI